jgi:hypothetical protein
VSQMKRLSPESSSWAEVYGRLLAEIEMHVRVRLACTAGSVSSLIVGFGLDASSIDIVIPP